MTRASSPGFLLVIRTRARSASGAKPPQLATAWVSVMSAPAGHADDARAREHDVALARDADLAGQILPAEHGDRDRVARRDGVDVAGDLATRGRGEQHEQARHGQQH